MKASAGRFLMDVYPDGSGIVLEQMGHNGGVSARVAFSDDELSDLLYVARKAVEHANGRRRGLGQAELEVR